MANVRNHFIFNGRDSSFRVSEGPWNRDSSYEKWEAKFRRPIDRENLELDLQINAHDMVEDTFQQVDELVASENNTMEIVEEAFEITNGL